VLKAKPAARGWPRTGATSTDEHFAALAFPFGSAIAGSGCQGELFDDVRGDVQ
jgi:hypothetical protein